MQAGEGRTEENCVYYDNNFVAQVVPSQSSRIFNVTKENYHSIACFPNSLYLNVKYNAIE